MRDYIALLNMDYDDCCIYLLDKYGIAKDDYFSKMSYERFKNGEIKAPTKKKLLEQMKGYTFIIWMRINKY